MTDHPNQQMLIEISDDGETLQLIDGSLWRIWPGDIPTSIIWLPTSTIEVQEISDDLCSHRLTNLSNDEQVRAIHGAATWSVENLRDQLTRDRDPE